MILFPCKTESLAVAVLKSLATTREFDTSLEGHLRDQRVYGISCKELRAELLSTAYCGNLAWPKVMENLERVATSVRTFHQSQHG